MVQEMVRQLVKVIKDRKLVQEALDLVSKVVRCHYIEEFLREDSLISIQKISLVSMLLH